MDQFNLWSTRSVQLVQTMVRLLEGDIHLHYGSRASQELPDHLISLVDYDLAQPQPGVDIWSKVTKVGRLNNVGLTIALGAWFVRHPWVWFRPEIGDGEALRVLLKNFSLQEWLGDLDVYKTSQFEAALQDLARYLVVRENNGAYTLDPAYYWQVASKEAIQSAAQLYLRLVKQEHVHFERYSFSPGEELLLNSDLIDTNRNLHRFVLTKTPLYKTKVHLKMGNSIPQRLMMVLAFVHLDPDGDLILMADTEYPYAELLVKLGLFAKEGKPRRYKSTIGGI